VSYCDHSELNARLAANVVGKTFDESSFAPIEASAFSGDYRQLKKRRFLD
jgi:hypothetical protein